MFILKLGDGYRIHFEVPDHVRWMLKGKYHRENGPAFEGVDGRKFWLLSDKYHREDGPACEWDDGTKLWYLNGRISTEQEVMQCSV